MASISSLGAGSGLDLENLLTQLLAAESRPAENRLNVGEGNAQAGISAFGSYRSALEQFQTAFAELSDASAFTSRSATTTNEDLFTASAGQDAALGSYDINVLGLASSQKLITTDFTNPQEVIGTGSLTIAAGIQSFDVSVTSGSLEDIVAAINDDPDNFGVSATVITVDDDLGSGTESRIVLTANATGAANTLTISVSDDDLTNEDGSGLSRLFYEEGNVNNQLIEQRAGTDARLSIDGFTVSSATNTFVDAISGVTITALAKSADPIDNPADRLTIGIDNSSISTNVTGFIDAYNSLQDTVSNLTQFDIDAGTSGALNGDFTVRTLQSQTRSILSSNAGEPGAFLGNLVNLGITTDDSGKLVLDETVFNEVLNTEPESVTAFFTGTSGLITRLDALFDSYLQSGGIIQSREDGLNEAIKDIDDERVALADRLESVESRFRNQFAALDLLVARLNSTGDFLLQQLSNTNSIITGNTNKDN